MTVDEKAVALVMQDVKAKGPGVLRMRTDASRIWTDMFNAALEVGLVPDVDVVSIIRNPTIIEPKLVVFGSRKLEVRIVDGINTYSLNTSGMIDDWVSSRFGDQVKVRWSANGFTINNLPDSADEHDFMRPDQTLPGMTMWLPSDMRAATWSDTDDIPSDDGLTRTSLDVCSGLPAPFLTFRTRTGTVMAMMAPSPVVGTTDDWKTILSRMRACWPGFDGLLRNQPSVNDEVRVMRLDDDGMTMTSDGASGSTVHLAVEIGCGSSIGSHHDLHEAMVRMMDTLLFTGSTSIGESYSLTRVTPILDRTNDLCHALADDVDGLPAIGLKVVTADDDGHLGVSSMNDGSDGAALSVTSDMMASISALAKSINDSMASMTDDIGTMRKLLDSGDLPVQFVSLASSVVGRVEELVSGLKTDLGTVEGTSEIGRRMDGGMTIDSVRRKLMAMKELQVQAADCEGRTRILLRTIQGWSPIPDSTLMELAKSIQDLRDMSKAVSDDEDTDAESSTNHEAHSMMDC